MKKGYLYIALTTVLFSTMEIALKCISGSFNPIQLTLLRFLIGGLMLLPLALNTLKKRKVRLRLSDWLNFAFLGFICVVISMLLYQLAVINTKASVVAVLFSSNPLFVLIFAFLFLKEPIHKNHIVSLVLEIIGIVAIIDPLNTKLSFAGIVFTMLSAVTFAFYGVAGKKKTAKFGGVVVTCFSFILGSLEMLILTLPTRIGAVASVLTAHGMGQFANIPLFTGFTAGNILTFLYVAIGITGAGYAFYFLAMEYTSANTASLVFFFKPALAPLLALIILKETIPMNMVVGILFILGGSIASLLPSLLKQKQPGSLQPHIAEAESDD